MKLRTSIKPKAILASLDDDEILIRMDPFVQRRISETGQANKNNMHRKTEVAFSKRTEITVETRRITIIRRRPAAVEDIVLKPDDPSTDKQVEELLRQVDAHLTATDISICAGNGVSESE